MITGRVVRRKRTIPKNDLFPATGYSVQMSAFSFLGMMVPYRSIRLGPSTGAILLHINAGGPGTGTGTYCLSVLLLHLYCLRARPLCLPALLRSSPGTFPKVRPFQQKQKGTPFCPNNPSVKPIVSIFQ